MLGEQALQKGIDIARSLYLDNWEEIKEAWQRGDGSDGVTVALAIKFSPAKKVVGAVDVDVSCSFVKDRVRVSDGTQVQEGQEELFEDDPAKKTYRLDPTKKMEATP